MMLRFLDSWRQSWVGILARKATTRRSLPFWVGLIVIAAATWMWISLRAQREASIRQKLESDIAGVERELASSLGIRVWTVADLAQKWQKQDNPPEEPWLSSINDVFAFHRGVPIVAWVDANFQPVWKRIANGTEGTALHDLDAGLGLARSILKPESRKTAVTPTFDLAAEGKGILIGSPLYRGSRLEGFLIYITSIEGLVNWRGPESISRGLSFALLENEKEIYRPRNVTEDAERELKIPVNYPGAGWNLRAWPSASLVAAERSYWPEGVLGGGLFLGLMLGLVVHLAQTTRHASEGREETKALFRSVFDNALDPMVVRDGNMRCVDANSAACLLFGLPRAQLLGTSVLDFVPPEDRALAQESMRDFLLQGRKRGFYPVVRSDGTRRELEFAATGNVVPGRHLTIYRDITERARQEAELAESEERYRDLFENATDLVQIVAPNGQVLYANPAWMETLGYNSSDIDSLTIFTIVHPERLPCLTEAFRKALVGEKFDKIELDFVTKSGKRITVDGSLSCLMLDGKPKSVRGIFRDVTQSKFLENQLRHKNEELQGQYRAVQESSRLKSEFLANMSHELRTPLNAIIGFAEMILDERVGQVTAEQRTCLDDVLSSATHLLQLINDVLDLSKVESGKMEFHPEPVNLCKLIAEVRDVLRSLAAQKNIRIDTDINPEIHEVIVDPSRLKQVLYNYLSNALKFTPDGGRVTIRVKPHGTAAFKIDVEDTGIGIAPEDIEKLFTEFHQVDAGTSKRYQGTGLGLALTKRIIEAQGGNVKVESTLGKGSVFGAIFPQKDGISLTDAPEETVRSLRNPDVPAILVIEDDSQERSWLLKTITEGGYIVETASTGAQALTWISSRKFDAVTLDLLLPDMSGWEILRKLRSAGPNQHTPVIVATLVSERDSATGFVIHDFLTKPIQAEQLLSAIEKAALEPNAHRPLLLVEP